MMRQVRLPALVAATVALLTVGAGPAVAKRPVPGAPSAKLEACTAGGQAGRSATFRGAMSTIADRRMEMRFDIYERRLGGRRWKRMPAAPGIGEWSAAAQATSTYLVRKHVSGLRPGISYRALVRFRWRAVQGGYMRASRFTASCRQRDTRPNLILRDPAIQAGPRADLVKYVVRVQNDGRGTAVPFSVTLAIDGVVQPAQRIGPLRARRHAVVVFQAARCRPGAILRFSVDARGEVDELDESDNALDRRCGDAGASRASRSR
ncbi:MAG: hypothetical protein LT070_05520 [Solirubrobacteraceae bacterium]|nr:hypothetical protein [Solirubrobacteraceae bacterium]